MSVTPELQCLTDPERAVLRLLAQGHTVKSIAREIGQSESAINERLREARRKTGVGSSRELARLLRAQESGDRENHGQEIRHREIGMAPGDRPPSSPSGAPPVARRPAKVIPMTLPLVLAAAAALALHGAGQQAPTPPVPPVAGGMTDQAAVLRARIAGETRDPAWADSAEAALRRRYRAVPAVDAGALTIACHATMCEVRGRSAAGVGDGRGRRGATELSSPPLRRSVPGLHADVTDMVSDGEGAAYRFTFDALWRRTDGG